MFDKSKGSDPLYVVLSAFIDVGITCLVVTALFFVWLYGWTNLTASAKADVVTERFYASNVVVKPNVKKVAGKEHFRSPEELDLAPVVAPVGDGRVGYPVAMLTVPKWHSSINRGMPIMEGTTRSVLAKRAAGHYKGTANAGEVGNFALAAHRRSHGNSFRRIDELVVGDELIVESPDVWYVYHVTSHEVVLPSASEVLAPVPHEVGVEPTKRLITLTTCHSPTRGAWGNSHRYIVYGELAYWIDKRDGMPRSLATWS